jgi:hypothetical protein
MVSKAQLGFLSSVKTHMVVVDFYYRQGVGAEMLAGILLLMAGMTVASGVGVLCGIRAPIEMEGNEG